MNVKFFNGGKGGNSASEGSHDGGTRELDVERNGKHRKAGELVHIGVQRGEAAFSEGNKAIGNQPKYHNAANCDPNADGQSVNEGGQSGQCHNGIKGEVGNAVQHGAKRTLVFGSTGKNAVNQVTDTAIGVQNKVPFGKGLYKQ